MVVPNQKKFDAVAALPAPQRYDHFIKTVADREKVWSLWRGGWASVRDNEGNEGLPVWPEQEYAEFFQKNEFPDWEVMPIDLYWLLDEMLPNIRAENSYLVVFPMTEGGIWPDLDRIEADLKAELSRYE